MTDKQFRFARTSQCYCLGQRENACSKANCTRMNSIPHSPFVQGRNNPARAGETPLAGSAPSLGRDW